MFLCLYVSFQGEDCDGRPEERQEPGRLAAAAALGAGPELDTVPPLREAVQRARGRTSYAALQEHQGEGALRRLASPVLAVVLIIDGLVDRSDEPSCLDLLRTLCC